ncbi:MAG: HNH endonuclease [Actinobacteria bacterium]|nr:HNH endonuclease [Actinomycetota bacterium]
MRGLVVEVIERVREGLAGFDPARLDGPAACDLTEAFAELERLAGAGKTLAAGRALGSGAWIHRGTHRTAEQWLAAVSGGSVAQAGGVLETVKRLDALPETASALRGGRLSTLQAEAVSAAASADPDAEGDLLASAEANGLAGLRRDCARVTAAACVDEMAAYERIRARRSLRHWRDPDGTGRIDVRGPIDQTARVMAALEPYERALFDANRHGGDHARPEQTAFDALVALATHRGIVGGTGTGGREERAADASGIATGGSGSAVVARPVRKGPDAVVVYHVSHDAYQRGHTVAGELCELEGARPVPVEVVRRAPNGDAALKALVTDGTDVIRVVHLGRTIPAVLRTAIEARDRECVIAGCHAHRHLEIDHDIPIHEGGTTSYENLHRLCRHHHHEKHRTKARLVGAPGHMRLERGSNRERPPP